MRSKAKMLDSAGNIKTVDPAALGGWTGRMGLVRISASADMTSNTVRLHRWSCDA